MTARIQLNLLSHLFGDRRKRDLGMNSAVIRTTIVVATVWTKRAVMGEAEEFQSAALNITWLISSRDSIPHSTRARLFQTCIHAIKS